MCEWCTGSHWLNDVKGLGPCVCVTPETLAEVENRLIEAQAALEDYLADKFGQADPIFIPNDRLARLRGVLIYGDG